MSRTITTIVMDYELRYTHDLHPIACSDDLTELKVRGRRSYDKVHIIETLTGDLIWQNSKSIRYGDACTDETLTST